MKGKNLYQVTEKESKNENANFETSDLIGNILKMVVVENIVDCFLISPNNNIYMRINVPQHFHLLIVQTAHSKLCQQLIVASNQWEEMIKATASSHLFCLLQ